MNAEVEMPELLEVCILGRDGGAEPSVTFLQRYSLHAGLRLE
jgi:hypothetical protein